MTLWTSAEAVAVTGGRATKDFEATGVSIDSRSVAPGDLFVALKDVRDGHEFVAQALEAGAAAALVSRIPEGCEDAPLLIVDDPLKGLEGLAAAARARSNARVVAVTGSVGKTSTKEMLRVCLEAQGATHAAEKSFNNHWGLPLTLARMPKATRFAVLEIGMNHPGEIRPLVKLARPHAAIITTVAPVHMAHFRSEAEIAFAKAEIFEGLEPGGVAILPRDNPHFERLARRARRVGVKTILRFGERMRCHAQLTGLTLGAGGSMLTARLKGRKAMVKIGAPGRHFALNALACLLAVDAVGADLGRAAVALGGWRAPDGRGSRWRIALDQTGLDGAVHLIDESYNANPTSMGAALEVLAASAPDDGVGRHIKGRRIAILGDMLELGPDEAALHAALAAHPALGRIDKVHTLGPLMKHLHDALPIERRGQHAPDSAAMAARVRRLLDAGDVVMVKGSLGAKMARVIEAAKSLGRAAPEAQDGEEGPDA